MSTGVHSPIRVRLPASIDVGATAYAHTTWTSFDRYDRYAAIAAAVRSALGPGPHRVLDVGDTDGYLPYFEPELDVIGIDVALGADRLDVARPLLASGAALPFVDDAFDAVVSSDVLEHVAPADRPGFLAELRRVSRDLVVVAAPFDTPGVAGVEEHVRRYALLSSGEPQPQLEEHHDNGLPNLEDTAAALAEDGRHVEVVGNGNLWDWLVAMVLRFQVEARPALRPLSSGFDLLHNQRPGSTLAPAPPFYRHLVLSWVTSAPAVGDPVTELPRADLTALAAVLVAADTSEVVRHDVNGMVAHQVLPPIAIVDAGLNALHERVGGFTELLLDVSRRLDEVQAATDHLVGEVAGLHAKVDLIISDQAVVLAPVRRARRLARRARARLRHAVGRT